MYLNFVNDGEQDFDCFVYISNINMEFQLYSMHYAMGKINAGLFSLVTQLHFTPEVNLKQLIHSQQFHEHGVYLVDSLWGVAGSELRDWETMTTLLLQEAGERHEM